MVPFPHQVKFANLAYSILKELGYVYIAGKPRCGKTYTSILICEKSDKINSVLVLTKKAAIPGWVKFIEGNTRLKHQYYVTNYEQIGTYDKLKLNAKDYDLVIIDESHNTGAFPKPSGRYKAIRKLCWDMPHIHLSGTAIVESPSSIYHQMFISKFTPFKHKNFYAFHKEFGEPYYIKAAGREINQDDEVKMLSTAVKKRKDSIEQFRNAGREELALKEEKELGILLNYLPKQLGEDEITFEVRRIASEIGAKSKEDFPKLMPLVMKELKGKVDGKLVKSVVENFLR